MEVQENLPQHSVTYIWKCKRSCSSVACMLLPHPTPLYHMKTSKKPTKRWFGFQPVGMNYNTHTQKLEDEATVWRIQRNIYININIYIFTKKKSGWIRLNQIQMSSWKVGSWPRYRTDDAGGQPVASVWCCAVDPLQPADRPCPPMACLKTEPHVVALQHLAAQLWAQTLGIHSRCKLII